MKTTAERLVESVLIAMNLDHGEAELREISDLVDPIVAEILAAQQPTGGRMPSRMDRPEANAPPSEHRRYRRLVEDALSSLEDLKADAKAELRWVTGGQEGGLVRSWCVM